MSKEFEDLLGQYWDLAHLEGKSGVSQGDKANEVLHALKKLAEQPAQQEPVLWLVNGVIQASDIPKDYTGCLFTSPPANANAGKPWGG